MADSVQLPPSRPTTRRARSIHIPSLDSLDLNQTSPEKRADYLKQDAYQIARVLGRDIRIKLRHGEEKGLRELIWSCGVMMDKVLGGVEAARLVLHVPLQIVDKLMLAVKTRSSAPQVKDNQ